MSRATSPLSGRVIFNVGARRSGTFWLQRTVTAHPRVAAVPSETHLISHGIAPLFGCFHHQRELIDSPEVGTVYVDRDAALDHARDLCDTVFAEQMTAESSHVAERTALHALHLDLIAELYPDGKVVHIIRDGRDVARSISAHQWGSDSVDDAAREWRDSIVAARAADLSPDQYREVRYEDLLQAPEREARALFDWLGIAVSAGELGAILAEADRRTNVDPIQPGVTIGKWRQAFSADELEQFMEVAGDLLVDLGYPIDDPAGGQAADPPTARRTPRTRRLLRSLRPADRAGSARARGKERIEQFLAALEGGHAETASELLARSGHVRVVCGHQTEEARGVDARALLRRALTEDDAFSATRIRREVHRSSPTSGVVVSYELGDGSIADRTLFVTLSDEGIVQLALYRPAA